MLQYCLVTIVEYGCSGDTFGKQTWQWGMIQGWAVPPHANTHRTGAGISVCEESALAASLQPTCRTIYGSRALPNPLLIKSLCT